MAEYGSRQKAGLSRQIEETWSLHSCLICNKDYIYYTIFYNFIKSVITALEDLGFKITHLILDDLLKFIKNN